MPTTVFDAGIIGNAIIGTDLDGKILLWNEGAHRLYGYEPEEVVGKANSSILHVPEDVKAGRHREIMDVALRDGKWEGTIERMRKNGHRFTARVVITPRRSAAGAANGFLLISKNISDEIRLTQELKVEELDRVHEELRARARQQSVIADLGLLALAGGDLQELLQQATACVADVLAVELCKVLELLPGRNELLLRAGVGWREGCVGRATVSSGQGSQAGYTLASLEPVVVEDLAAETRCHGPPLLFEHRVVSGLSVIIGESARPWGVLGAHTTHRRRFDPDQVSFLQSVANVLAQAIARKTTEAALQESERRAREQLTELEQIYRTAPVGLALLDRDLRWLRINDRLAEVDGCSAASHLGRTPREVIPELAPTIESLMRRVLETGESVTDLEVQGVVPSQPGVERDWLVNFYPVRAEDGSIRAVSTVVQEITERRRAEQAVRAAERHLRRVLDTLPAMVGILAPDGTLLDGNRLPLETFGVQLEKVIGQPFADLYPMSASPAIQADIRKALQRAAEGEIVRFDLELPTPSGQPVVADAWFAPIKNDEGRLTHVIASGVDITERKRAEALLKESQQRLALATESAHIGIWDWDVVANKLTWDPRMYALYGIRGQDFGGAYEAWEKGLHPEDRERAVAEVNAALAGTKDFHTQFRVVWPNGVVRHIEAHGVVQRAANGSPLHMIGANWDITERKQAEEKLLASEVRYRRLFEAAHDGILILNADSGIIIDVNPFLCELLGLAREAICGKELWELGSFKDIAASNASFLQLQQKTFIRYEDLPLETAQGRLAHVEFVSNVYEAGNEKVIQCNIRDITERKRTEDALREAHDRLNTMIQASPLALVVIDLQGIVQTWNPAAERLFGWTAAEVVGRPIPIVPEEDRRQFEDLTAAAMKGECCKGLEMRRLRKDGSLIDVSLWTAPLHDANGRVVGTIRKFVDLTDRKRAEAAVRAANEHLIRLSQRIIEVQEEERRHLARELHDEIGQVLTAVFYNLNALKTARDPITPSRLDDSLAVVDQAIQQVRTMSLDLRPSMLDDLGLAPTVKWYAERLAQRTGLTIHLTAPPAGVDLPAEVKITCFRVAQEAMTNVARHAHARHLWLELLQGEDEVRLVIRDDGVGFDVTAARRRAARGGSVGLLGMQERVELIGGEFSMESDPGKGTTIRVRFDLQELAAKLAKMGIAGGGG